MRALASGAARQAPPTAAQQRGRHFDGLLARHRLLVAAQRPAAGRMCRCSARHRQQPRSQRPSMAAAAAGGADPPPGNGDGGGSGGSGDSSDGDSSGGDAPNLGSNIWMLAVAAAAALGLFSVGSKRLKLRRQLVQAGLGQQAADASGGSRWGWTVAAVGMLPPRFPALRCSLLVCPNAIQGTPAARPTNPQQTRGRSGHGHQRRCGHADAPHPGAVH